MLCLKCGTENSADALFCEQCGAKLELSCAICGAPVNIGARFCRKCGTQIVERLAPPAKPLVRVGLEQSGAEIIESERKTVTALFADIKGSMELIEDLDPEQARAIVDPALRLMIDAVHRYDGYIVQSTGDGIFALFGAPVAHEDHPQRALYSALRLQEELRRYSVKLREAGNLAVEARVGINTGEVVVRSIRTDDTHTEYTPIGHSTSVAARMQALAPTGSIATTEQTRRLCEGYFTFKVLGPTRIKGVSEPINVVEVTGLGPLRTRLQVAARRGLTKFVGRQAELEQMKRALELARAGHGQIVAAIGEPGVGKSRLFFEFKAIAHSGCLVLEAYSVSHGKASAYLPVIDLLKGYFEIVPDDDERKRREKLNGKIITLDRTLEDTLPYLFGLLEIVEGDDSLAQLDPQLKRRRTLEAIKRILIRESLNQPLIVVFEDLHWIDSETQALLNLIADALATARILLLVNYRPEYHHQWANKTYYSQLRLDPLGRESAEEMLAALLGCRQSPAEAGATSDNQRKTPETQTEKVAPALAGDSPVDIDVGERVRVQHDLASLKRLIIERTEGNPFFMEEMVQALFEQGILIGNGAVKLVKPLDEIRVPSTVQAILASRIDRLSAPEKDLLQTLAVLGREFSSGLIKHVARKSDDELERMLSELQLAEFIYEQPAFPDIEYTFKHALTQEVAYHSVLSERRRMLHERTAQAIEALFADRLDDHLPELAHHYDRSGDVPKAVEYLRRAGLRAARQVAHSEAIGYFNRALELLKQLPDGADRDRQELALQLALGWSLAATRGPRASELEPRLNRARELSEKLGDSLGLLDALLGLATFHHGRELFKAQGLIEMALALAENVNAPVMLAQAHSQMGVVLMAIGSFEAALRHMKVALDIGLKVERASKIGVEDSPRSFRRAALGLMSNALVELGYTEAALNTSQEFLSVSRQLSDPETIGPALFFDAWVRVKLRDSRTVMERAQELLSISNETGSLFYLNHAKYFRGWAMAAAGQGRNGIADMREAVSGLVPVGGLRTVLFAALAQACASHGLCEEGFSAVAAGLEHAEQTGEHHSEADLLRTKGELILMQNPADAAAAERCFRTAIDIARHQAAKLFELRATISLARLLKNQGKIEEARKMLSEIYNWFTEGFDIADLRDAKALLDELAA